MLKKIYKGIKLIPFFLKSYNNLKFFLKWFISAIDNSNPLQKGIPWINFEARKWLKKYLKSNMIVFEYGSGGSTIFFSNRVKKVISIEHDKSWYKVVLKKIKKENLTNCKIFLYEPQLNFLKKFNNHMSKKFSSDFKTYNGINFKNYVTSINKYPDNNFDFVFIDGRARASCIVAAIPKIKIGGYLMLDNSERKRYEKSKKIIKNWKTKIFYGVGPYCNHPWETTIWEKPII